MVDTIVIESPIISYDLYDFFEKRLILKQAVDVENDNLLYSFTSGSLVGSWDSHISIQLRHEVFVYDKDKAIALKQKIIDGFVIRIELSLHKFIEGHNVYGGTDDIIPPLQRLFYLVEGYFNVDLPELLTWKIKRLDYANNFELDQELILHFFREFSKIRYPRRKTRIFNGETLYFSGTTTTFKIYNKGLEFNAHDYKRLLKMNLPDDELSFIKQVAQNVLRVEVEIKPKKLKDLEIIFVQDYDKDVIISLYDKEVEKVMKFKNETVINKNEDVLSYLTDNFSSTKARSLYSSWVLLCTQDPDYVKSIMARSTLARHVKALKDCGISWLDSDIDVFKDDFDNIIPVDFNLYSYSKYKLAI